MQAAITAASSRRVRVARRGAGGMIILVTVRSGDAAVGGSCQLATAPRSQLTHSDPWSAVRSQEAEFPRSFLIQQQPVSHRGRGCKPLFSEYSRVRLRGSSSVNTTLPLALRRTRDTAAAAQLKLHVSLHPQATSPNHLHGVKSSHHTHHNISNNNNSLSGNSDTNSKSGKGKQKVDI